MILSAQASLRGATDPGRKFLDMREHIPRRRAAADRLADRAARRARVSARRRSAIGRPGRTATRSAARSPPDCGRGDDLLLLAQGFFYLTPWAHGGAFTASHRLQLSAVYDLTREVAVQIGARAAIRGVNDSAERGLIGALWYRF